MKFIPYYNYSVKIHLSPYEVQEILKKEIEPRKLFRFSGVHSYFEGKISGCSFKISRIIHYRNSFLPVITGSINQHYAGSEINISFRLNIFTGIFMSIWFSGVFLAFLFTLPALAGSIQQGRPELHLIIPSGMLAFGYALIYFGFWREQGMAKRKLDELFDSKQRRDS